MIETAKKEDFKELLSFENRVFKINFETKVPKVYRFPESAALHGVYRENGRIAAGICVLPGELLIGEERLITAGIGSVAVSKSVRGHGLMGELMEYAEKRSLAYSADIGFLSGYRFRYQRFGYVPAGIQCVFEVTDHLIAHTKASGELFVTPVKTKEDETAVYELYSAQEVRFLRERERFAEILKTWHSETYLVKDGDQNVCGYLIYKKDENVVSELILRNNSLAREALVLFAKEKKRKNIFVRCCAFQRELLKELLSFGEHYRTEAAVSLKIYNFKNFIQRMLALKARLGAVQSGSLVLGIGNETLRITVDGKKVEVLETSEKADIAFDRTYAALALTRPEAASTENALFNAWTPLCPFSIFSVDTV